MAESLQHTFLLPSSSPSKMQDPRFDTFKVPGLSGAYYVSEFISEPEEDHLVKKVSSWTSSPTSQPSLERRP